VSLESESLQRCQAFDVDLLSLAFSMKSPHVGTGRPIDVVAWSCPDDVVPEIWGHTAKGQVERRDNKNRVRYDSWRGSLDFRLPPERIETFGKSWYSHG
jgi:hypothetical protein